MPWTNEGVRSVCLVAVSDRAGIKSDRTARRFPHRSHRAGIEWNEEAIERYRLDG